MKKVGYLIVGAVFGAVLMFTVSVSADGIGLIGKKVQSQADVVLNGKKIDTAIIVDGSSYAPIRSLTNALGLDISYSEGTVTLKDKVVSTENKQKLKVLEEEKRNLVMSIESDEYSITKGSNRLKELQDIINSSTSTAEEKIIAKRQYDNTSKSVEEISATLKENQAKLAIVNKQIAELESTK